MNRMISELLADPMIQLLMLADRVDQRALAADLRRLAWRLASAERVAAVSQPKAGHGQAFAPSAADVAATTQVVAPVCGARCS